MTSQFLLQRHQIKSTLLTKCESFFRDEQCRVALKKEQRQMEQHVQADGEKRFLRSA